MAKLEDGATSQTATVNADGQLATEAVTSGHFDHNSEHHGRAFSWASGTYDPAAADTILLVKNTSTSFDLLIHHIWLSTDVDTRVIIHVPTTTVTTPAGTTVTGVNLNTGSNNVADSVAMRDETNNSQGDVVWSGEIYAVSGPIKIDFEGSLILARNKSVGVDYVADVAACDVTIFGHFG